MDNRGRKFQMYSNIAQKVSPVLPDPSLMQPLFCFLLRFWLDTLLHENPLQKTRTRGTQAEAFVNALGTDVNTSACRFMVLKQLHSRIIKSRSGN